MLNPRKAFEEMAAEDEYIHSDSLNVKRPVDAEQEMALLSSSKMDNFFSFQQKHYEDKGFSDSRGPIHEDEFEVNNSNNALQLLEIEASESEDPILSLDENSNRSMNSVKGNRSKNTTRKHRFLEDLDQRIAKDNNAPASLATSLTSLSDSDNEKNRSTWGILSNTALGTIISSSTSSSASSPKPSEVEDYESANPKALPPLSRQRLQFNKSSSKSPSDTLENVTKVTSTAMLNADELLALEQMKHATSSGHETKWADLFQKHPREAFVLFILLLSAVLYFHSRRFSQEDDLN